MFDEMWRQDRPAVTCEGGASQGPSRRLIRLRGLGKVVRSRFGVCRRKYMDNFEINWVSPMFRGLLYTCDSVSHCIRRALAIFMRIHLSSMGQMKFFTGT